MLMEDELRQLLESEEVETQKDQNHRIDQQSYTNLKTTVDDIVKKVLPPLQRYRNYVDLKDEVLEKKLKSEDLKLQNRLDALEERLTALENDIIKKPKSNYGFSFTRSSRRSGGSRRRKRNPIQRNKS